ncbi:protein ITPRID2 isoform X2 [Dunckerocampus dactyliophorus]|uniref:protein ITPRID2 isoform X2 n=1 Tax=Dunckerocampus dactyliophorus TaxID=161453 RepID=UPI0024056635|nr:protein ITPRID2 isoform X2 [Dunckerocampus dactyliophorus]
MERETVGLDPVPAPDPSGSPDCSLASLRRRAWAKSRDSTWQETQKPESSSPLEPQPNSRGTDGDSQRTSEAPGLTPNKITSWLDQCRTPLAVSLDDQSASPSKGGALRNGCSFEDDLSLGAEADHLQSSNKKTGSCGGLAANQKRSQYKEKGRSMNSTGSGKSSTVSSVSELLDLYEEDPEEILLNLGFGRDEPDMSSRIPSRFFDSSSSARGIDIKVYLGAQLQRMEVENPDFALTSRFRQIEVLTTVANQFIQLYGHVSGQPVQSVSSRDQGGEGGGDSAKEESPPSLKRRNSALNAAKLLKKTLSKHNLLTPSSESSGARKSSQPANKGQPNDDLANSHTNNGPAQDGDTAEHDHHADSANQKHIRKKDSCSLATVTEETNGDGELERLTEDSNPAPNSKHQPGSADSQQANRTADEQTTKVDEKNIISTTDKAPSTLALPQLLHLRTEKADSFDMEEIQSNEDEALLSRRSMNSDLLRTASQHSDSSGFAEEPSVESSNLKVQESSDSCDSETTVTSHPSQDVSTPIALDQPTFILPDFTEEEAEPVSAAEAVGSSQEEDECDGTSEQFPQYTAHQLPKNCPQVETQYVEQGASNLQPEPEPEQSQNQEEAAVGTEPSQEAADEAQVGPSFSLLASNSPILTALSRAKQRLGSHSSEKCSVPSRRRLRGGLPLLRSSSFPSSLLSPSKVVSSVKIEFGRGQTSCSQPRYAFRYIQEPAGEQVATASSTCISTLVINHSPKSSNPSTLLAEDSAPPKLTPRHLVHSSCSLRCASPPLDWPAGRSAQPWITQSVPDLSSNQEQFGRFQQGVTPDQPVMFVSPSPSPTPNLRQEAPLSAPPVNPSFLYPTPFHPYASLPNLHHSHHSSMPSLLPQPSMATPPKHTNISHLHPPAMATPPQYTSLWNLHPGTPTMHHFHPNSYHLYHSAPHTPPYLGSHGYDINQDHILHRGSAPPGPGIVPGLGSGLNPNLGFGPGLGPHPGLSPNSTQVLSSTEMQLRRVLHDIRGTVQRLNQNQDDTSDVFTEHRASSQQSLADLQQKRRNLSLFRTQMMDLELSIIRQQALVYKYLSPTDRLEVEHLQSLRSAVRDELLELEQQLEDKVMELTQHGPSRVSDLLREQYLLQSQLSCDDNTPSTAPPSPPTSHTLSGGGEQRPGVYRAFINITPAPPPRPSRQVEAEKEMDEGRGALNGGKGIPWGEEEEQAAEVKGENLQDLIREIRESMAQEVRREIYNELMAAVSPRRSPLPAARQ